MIPVTRILPEAARFRQLHVRNSQFSIGRPSRMLSDQLPSRGRRRMLAVATLASVLLASVGNAQKVGQATLPMPRSPRIAPDGNGPSIRREGDGLVARESRYLIEQIDPEMSLDVVTGRPTVLRFRVPPFRDQVGDPDVVDLLSITESEVSITGKKVGSTTLNFWFKDPQSGEQDVLSYLVRVSDDPEQSRQFERLLENLERDIIIVYFAEASWSVYIFTSISTD